MKNKIPDRPRFLAVSQCAWEVIKYFGFHHYPIDVSVIYKALPIVVNTYQHFAARAGLTLDNYIDVVGAKDGFSIYDKNKNKYVVAFNTQDMTKCRIRWTLAHELGHIVLNHFDEFEDTRLSQTGLTEEEYGVLDVEANVFASELLCSPAMVGLLPEHERNIDFISNLFVISKQAAEKTIEQWLEHQWLHKKHAAFFEQQFSSYLYGGHESA